MDDPNQPPYAPQPRPPAASSAEDRKLRTRFALQALGLGDVFDSVFADYVLPGRILRRVQLSVPDGLSTAGGAQANQSISLVPEDAKAGILVAGHVNGVALSAELRGFPYVNETHRLRFGKPVDFSAGAYQQLLTQVEQLLKANGYAITVVNQIPEATRRRLSDRHASTHRAPGGGGSAGFWIVLALLLLAGAGVASYFLLME